MLPKAHDFSKFLSQNLHLYLFIMIFRFGSNATNAVFLSSGRRSIYE